MRSALLISALAAVTLAAPRPQAIEFDLVDAAPDPAVVVPPVTGSSETVPTQPAAAAAALGTQAVDSTTSTSKRSAFLGKRDGDCAMQPAGTGQAVGPSVFVEDTPDAFLNYAPFHTAAQSANIPQGYNLSFSDLSASTSSSVYMGFTTLKKYDPIACQQVCDAAAGCAAFNLYFERDPSKDPNATYCPNPTSVTNIKCVKWGVRIDNTTAVNTGESRDSFKVVISGSNGYNKIDGPPTALGYNGPVALGGAINAPNDPTTNTNTYAGVKFFGFGDGTQNTVTNYNNGALACLAAATQQGSYNSRHTTQGQNPAISNQVVTYVLSKNNIPQGVQCAIYTESWASNYATNVGQYRGSDYYSVSQAYSYINATYAAQYAPICNVGGCSPYNMGGSCGGFGQAVNGKC